MKACICRGQPSGSSLGCGGCKLEAVSTFQSLHRKDIMSRVPYRTHAQEEAFIFDSCKQLKSHDANAVSFEFVSLLKSCAKHKDLSEGSKIHTHIATHGFLDRNVFLGSALISMYAKCGALDKAQQAFDELPIRNEVSWNTLIAAYAKQGQGEEALQCFKHMQAGCFPPDAFTFSCVLKSCSILKNLDKGQEIHAQIVQKALIETDIVLASSLVDMYIKCGALEKAQELFDELPTQDRFLWTALITGYCERGLGVEAISLYERMQLRGCTPDAVTFVCTLKACGSMQACPKGEEIHAQIVRRRLLEKDLRLGTALVDMYAKCGAFEKAQEVFDELPTRDVVLWNAMITGCAQLECAEDALKSFQQMQLEGFCPTSVTFACILKSCGSLKAQDKGREVHAQIVKEHLQEGDAVVGNALIDMYAKCGLLVKAQEVFDELLFRDNVSWTALIVGYTQHGQGEDAIRWFEHMQGQGFSPDAVTLSCILKACGSIGALKKGEEVHAQIVREKILEREIVVANALLYMYARCGALEKAQEVFDEILIRSVVSWNTMIAAYTEQGCWEEAMLLFEEMQRGYFPPDTVTFVCMLKACGFAGAAYTGQELHNKIVKFGLLNSSIAGNALVAMYSNCGMLREAHKLFDKLFFKDVALWSTLMLGYSQLGKDELVFSLFDSLVEENIEPNSIIFTVLFNTCSHRGLLDMGQMCFHLISKGNGIVPTIEHYTCIVDLLCRANDLEKAVLVVNEMPLFPDLSMWHTVLGACQKWRLLKLGKWAFEHAVEVDNMNAATYVSMGNIFVTAGKQNDANIVEASRNTRLPKKQTKSSGHNAECYFVQEYLGDGHIYVESDCVDFWPPDNVLLPDLHLLVSANGDEVSKDRTRKIVTVDITHPKTLRCVSLESKTPFINFNALLSCTGFINVQRGSQSCSLSAGFQGWSVYLQRLWFMLKFSYFISAFISLELAMAYYIQS